ncbi:MAG: amino acid permease [Phycisphaerales bacterium]|nr:amino acid permease [Phycisphaerales bacterium]
MSGILTSAKRPRNLTHWHAGPLLFGDWGTSRLYVLGIGAVTLGLAAPYYLLALSLLMVAVAWAYTIVCRLFQDGGGVYSAARRMSPLLSVIGATLLLGNYIVTASLSTVEAFVYFGVPSDAKWLIVGCSTCAFLVLGVVNWFGPRSAGELAKWVAVASVGLGLIVAVMVLPWVPAGLRLVRMDGDPMVTRWMNFTGIILALSGVEAVANMTGIMSEPVKRTAARTIWPVLGEVALFNLIFGVALLGLLGASNAAALPAIDAGTAVTIGGDEYTKREVHSHAMKIIAIEGGQLWLGAASGLAFGKVTAVAFGLLLLSAANTVIVGMISLLYSLGRDRELHGSLARLNYSGVPSVPLLIACAAPAGLLLVFHDIEQLAPLYAIGVTGAIALNLCCCVLNRSLEIKRWERAGMSAVALLLATVFVTIAITNSGAAVFAGLLVLIVLLGRGVARLIARRDAKLPEPQIGWLAELQRKPLDLDPNKPRIMLAARGRHQAEYAVDLARRRGATLFAIYVRTLRVIANDASSVPRIEEDPDAQEALGTVAVLARQVGVPFVPIYCSSPDIAEEILDYTVTFGCDTLIMGKSRRTNLARQLGGDPVAKVATLLPEGVSLIARDSTPHGVGPEAQPDVVKGKAWENAGTGDEKKDDDPEDVGHA